LSPTVASALSRIYVPNVRSGDVYVIDPATLRVVDKFKAGHDPQHVIPSWDLKSLWVAGSMRGSLPGSLTEIDPRTARPVRTIAVDDAYNMYFTPDGKWAIVVAEQKRRLEFRDPHTMVLEGWLAVPQCAGINHADFAPDDSYAIFTCEFAGALAKIDLRNRRVLGVLKLAKGGMPQDIRSSPDGSRFYVANMISNGMNVIQPDTFKEIGFVPTGIGTHGLYPSRDGRKLYVTNRGSNAVDGKPNGAGSVSVFDFATGKVETTWPVPGGGSPDMGNVSVDGRELWVSGRFDGVVYVFDTQTGSVKEIPVGRSPHGLAVWPQPGRYSLGHTGMMR
jgi:YVTN family beta-propeller protein